ncbi:MAG: DoxX family protein [Pyrinomonadaceae bacterium]
MSKEISKVRLWTSYILQGLIVLNLLMGSMMNLLQTEMAVNGAKELGYPESAVFYLGIVLLVTAILFAIPKTTFIGAILLTGWLGGAVASHVIHRDPAFNVIFPVIFGILVWFSIWLRSEKIQNAI